MRRGSCGKFQILRDINGVSLWDNSVVCAMLSKNIANRPAVKLCWS